MGKANRKLIDTIKNSDVLPEPPFRQVIVGPSTSGKTTLLINFLLYFYKDTFSKIYVVSPTFYKDILWRSLDDEDFDITPIIDYDIESVKKAIDEIEDEDGECLIIFDDVGEDYTNKSSQKNDIARLTNTIMHTNCSIIRLHQTFTQLDGTTLSNVDMLHTFALLRKKERDQFHDNFGLFELKNTKELLKDTTNTISESERRFLSVKRKLGKYIYFKNLKKIDDGYYQ